MSLDSDQDVLNQAYGDTPAPSADVPKTDADVLNQAYAPEKSAASAPSTSVYDPNKHAFGDSIEQQIHGMVSGIYHQALGGFKGLGTLIKTGAETGTSDWDAAANVVKEEEAKAYVPPPSGFQNPQMNFFRLPANTQNPTSRAMLSSMTSVQPEIGNVLGLAAGLRFPERPSAPAPRGPMPDAQAVVNQVAAKQSGGAAGAAINVDRFTPETKSEIVSAAARGEELDPAALQRHALAESLPLPEGISPLRLRKGQATGDAQQISDEKNLRADPDIGQILRDSITDQDSKLVASLGEIRRQATPDIVQRNNLEHGQASIDSIKTMDNARLMDIRAKYKALADANGGALPIDTGTAIADIDAQLKGAYLTKTAADNGVISEVLADLRSGNPIDFERFESARTGLAEVQRAGGSAGKAAGIVHDALENMPLSADAAQLKGLADTARSAARARFTDIRNNPAYEAVVNDNVPKVNGLHQIGKESPLADSFMDRYVLGNGTNASKAYVRNLKTLMQSDPTFSESIEAATLNKLRDAAGIDAVGNSTGFRNDSFRNQVNALDKKADVLMRPETRANIEHLKQVGGIVNDEGKAGSTNRANTALTLQRFGAPVEQVPSVAGDLAKAGVSGIAHAIPGGKFVQGIAESALSRSNAAKNAQALRDAKMRFAIDATKPGAGISRPASNTLHMPGAP